MTAPPAQNPAGPPSTEDEPPRTRRERLLAGVLAVSAFLLLYALSAGPMVGLVRTVKMRPFERAVEVLYAPLVIVVKKNVEPFSSILKWYVELFR